MKALKESTAASDSHLQMQIDKNDGLLRADVAEIKQDVKKLLQRGK
jgi:hypothetical protein